MQVHQEACSAPWAGQQGRAHRGLSTLLPHRRRGRRRVSYRRAGASTQQAPGPEGGRCLEFHPELSSIKSNYYIFAQDGENKARKVAIYSVDTHPMDGGKIFCTAGRDQYVRLYDRRYISATQNEAPPMKKFCPHHLVRAPSIP